MKFNKWTIGLALTLTLAFTGCVTDKQAQITPATTNTVTGAISPAVTNEVVVVNQANLDLDCAGLQLVGTPALIHVLSKDPSARPIVVDIDVALSGALNGADTNVVAKIDAILGSSNNAALDAFLQPLIAGDSTLEQQLLAKYGSVAGVQISKAILTADLNIVNAALAVPVPAPAVK